MLKKRAALREVAPLTPINEGTPAVRLNDVLSSHNPLGDQFFDRFELVRLASGFIPADARDARKA